MVVAAITLEASTARVQPWVADQSAGSIVISDWVVAEVSSALSLKVRTGVLDPAERVAAAAVFRRQMANSFRILPVSKDHFEAAARLADRYDLGLRAGDALHLAIAADNGTTLVTLDRRLFAAAQALGHAVETV